MTTRTPMVPTESDLELPEDRWATRWAHNPYEPAAVGSVSRPPERATGITATQPRSSFPPHCDDDVVAKAERITAQADEGLVARVAAAIQSERAHVAELQWRLARSVDEVALLHRRIELARQALGGAKV